METIFKHLRYLYANMLQVTIMQKDPIICNGMNSSYFSKLRSKKENWIRESCLRKIQSQLPKFISLLQCTFSDILLQDFYLFLGKLYLLSKTSSI